MVYLLNTHIHHTKKLVQALSRIYGLGTFQCSQICHELGFSPNLRFSQLSDSEVDTLTQFILQNYEIGSEQRRIMVHNIQRLMKMGAYRGFRHTEGFPVRGQRTHGNSRTARKLKKTVH